MERKSFDEFVGLPWKPYPGVKGRAKLRSKVMLPIEPGELTRPVGGKDGYVPRRVRVTWRSADTAANRCPTAVMHTEESRKRIEGESEKAGGERLACKQARLFENSEESEAKKRNTINSEMMKEKPQDKP